MLTSETPQPERFVTGGVMQQTIRKLSEGVTPTQIYNEIFPESDQAGNIQEIVAYPYDPREHPDILRDLERERLRAGQMTSAVEAYLQARADVDVSELAVNNEIVWPEIIDSMRAEQPEAWQLTHQELPDHPEPIIDFVASISALNHISTVDAGKKLNDRDPKWRDAFISARLHSELTINKMNEIIDSLVHAKPELRQSIELLRRSDDLGAYADNLSGLLRQEYGIKVHPRVIIMGLNSRADDNPQYLYRDIAPDTLDIRVANARTAFEAISAYASILYKQNWPESTIVTQLLSDGNIKQMASWTQRTLRHLPFTYVSGLPPNLSQDVNNWRAMLARVSETARIDSDGTIIVQPNVTQGATRGHCPVQHSLEDTHDSAGQDSSAAAFGLEKHTNLTFDAHPRLVREVVRGNDTLRAVRLSEIYTANAILLAAKPGGPLDHNTDKPLWRLA